MKRSFWWYTLLAAIVIFCDQLSKFWALRGAVNSVNVTTFLDFELTFNRGVSWGLLSFSSPLAHGLVSVAIFAALSLLAVYTLVEWLNHRTVIAPVMLFAGGLSNWIDRLMRPGVVDFIKLHAGGFVWPTFNIADMCVVLGLIIIIAGFSRDK
ncbi:signal peptidase II [bacterium]|jgi:signal peptidase II|nr:signal peptidase II [bacterium]MBT3903955.1 signal peptidase II [bacterium]MBT4578071.1 signal peptidase II [bacterium]MBT5345644.1 signal peptidase II [bacterium]MBT6130669.1 signal peptidase II [bacterium]